MTRSEAVVNLQALYGPPSQAGFGSAVFRDRVERAEDLEAAALKYYRYFLGKAWEQFGEEAWMASWQRVYQRPAADRRDIVTELRSITDPSFAAAVAKKRKADNSSASEDDIFDWIGSSMKESTEGQQYVTGVLCRGIVSRTFSSSGPKDNPLHPVILDFRNRYLAKRIVESPADKIYITYGGAHLPGVVEELRKLNPNWKLVSIKWMRSIAAPEQLEGTLSLAPAGKE